jgi:hypothetical protein
VKGIEPDTVANGTGNFTIDPVSWSPTDNPFLGDAVYTASLTLTANSGYSFTGLSDTSINGQSAEVSNNTGAKVSLSYTFPATSTKTVTRIAIKTQPTKLNYTHGDTLDLTGLVVTFTYDDTSTEDVAALNFNDKNITANPAHGNNLVRLSHDSHPVTITYGSFTQYTSNLAVAAQSGEPLWAKTITAGTYGAEFYAVTVDASGNVYAAGLQKAIGNCNYGSGNIAGTASNLNPVLVKYSK